MDHDQKSRELIASYVGRVVRAELDGVLLDDQPGTFTFRFADPAELRDAIAELHPDEMAMEPWSELVPVAAVSMPERWDQEFAWVFLDWSEDAPRVRVATHDNWGGELVADGLDALGLVAAG